MRPSVGVALLESGFVYGLWGKKIKPKATEQLGQMLEVERLIKDHPKRLTVDETSIATLAQTWHAKMR